MIVILFLEMLLVLSVVGIPPVIIKQPVESEILFKVSSNNSKQQTAFEISCEAEGSPQLEYRWIKDGKSFNVSEQDDRIVQEAESGTLKFLKPNKSDIGIYSCIVENKDGVARTSNFSLRRVFLENFKNVTVHVIEVIEGESFKLECNTPNAYPNPNIFWMIQTTYGAIKGIENSQITSDTSGNLWFSPVSREHASKDSFYVCSAASAIANEYKLGDRYVLKVLPKLTRKFMPAKLQYASQPSISVLRGKTAEIFCIFYGTPTPKVLWSKNVGEIEFNERIFLENYGKSLKIKKIDANDEGIYFCNVTSENGEILSSKFHLKVEFPPTFAFLPESKNVTISDSIEFKCQANAKPAATIQWFFNGEPIQHKEKSHREYNNERLIINNVKASDQGNYACYATNEHGYSFKDIYVNVWAK